MENVKRQIQEYYKKHLLERPFIIAIDGLSGAGKTTLANDLKKELNQAVIIHIDDHIVERAKRYDTGYDEWFEFYQLQWDTDFLREYLFHKLHQNTSELSLPFYDKEKDIHMEKKIEIPTGSIVIIEGVFLLREEWKAFYDYMIFLDVPKDLRNERVLLRDHYIGNMEERLRKYENRYWVAEDYYLEKQEPLKLAHYVYREAGEADGNPN